MRRGGMHTEIPRTVNTYKVDVRRVYLQGWIGSRREGRGTGPKFSEYLASVLLTHTRVHAIDP